jgi:hypothetical protein
MATYKEIFGKQIKFLSSDPANEAEGQIWYNSTSGTFKSVLVTEGVSSGANLATGRTGCAGGGIQSAAWVSGGSVSGPPPTSLQTTEEYNGTGWASGGDMTTARGYAGSGGPQTAGIAAGGFPYPAPPVNMTTVESYNGTTWSGETALPTAVWTNGIIGSEPACVSVGRGTPTSDNAVFNYDGSTWTTGGTRNSIRGYTSMAAGVQTAGIIAGGYEPPLSPPAGVKVESYDGTSWTSETDCNADTYMGSLSGSQTSIVKMGGQTVTPPVVSNAVETYDGSSWATSPATLTTARGYVGMTGNSPSSSAGLISGGSTTGGVASTGATEEFTRSENVVVAGAWGSAPIMNTARSALGAARNGTKTSCLAFSGYEGSPAGIKTEEFDGSTWTNKNSMGTGRYNTPGTGIVTAALAAGGNAPPESSATEEFDGTNWAANPTGLNTARYTAALTGTQTAALLSGGTDPSVSNATETYNGSTWTTSPGTLNVARASYNAGAGTQTATVMWSGYAGPPGQTNVSEEFDGTSWTAGNTYLLSAKGVTGGGTLAAAWSASGNLPANSALGFSYDGTNWSTTPSLGAAKYNCAGGGASGAGIIFGGTTGVPLLNTTEEFTGETSTLNYETITTS